MAGFKGDSGIPGLAGEASISERWATRAVAHGIMAWTGLLASWLGESGQIRKEAATADHRECRGSGSSPNSAFVAPSAFMAAGTAGLAVNGLARWLASAAEPVPGLHGIFPGSLSAMGPCPVVFRQRLSTPGSRPTLIRHSTFPFGFSVASS